MHPYLIETPWFSLPTYGVILALAVALAVWLAKLRADRHGLDGNRVVDLSLTLVLWALIGSKLLLVIVELPRFLRDPAQLVTVIRAGGVFLGGFLAAAIAGWIVLKRAGLPFLKTADVMAPSIALGQAIGRLGCLAAGCCYGRECHEPWAVTYTSEHAHANVGTPLGVPLHPFPIYAFLFNLAHYGVLAWLIRRGLATGRVFGTYLIVYGVGRSLLELTRGDISRGLWLGGSVSTSQLISAGLVISGVIVHVVAARRAR
jgi:phosphatidylglycerol:prolipoprotein diacylglycerol transferase